MSQKQVSEGFKVAKVVISGYYGFGNAGDEAVLAGIVRSFAERSPDTELIVLSSDPAETTRVHGVRAVPRTSISDVISAIRSSDLLISGGGSLLQDVTSSRSLMYYLGIIWLAKRLGKKVMIYAQGIGPISGASSRRFASRLLNQVDLITVRDDPSKAYLTAMGVDRPPVSVTADPSFVMEAASDEFAEEVLKASGAHLDMPLIGVSLRSWKDQAQWLPAIADGLQTAAQKVGASLVFLPMQREQDLGICIQVASGMNVPSSVVAAQLEPSQMLAIVKRMSLTVGMRLHSLIFSASAGVPYVGLSYDPKVEAFVRSTTHEGPIKIDSASSSELANRIIDAWERRDDLTALVTEKTDKLRSVALSNAEMACDLIGAKEQ